jgi:transposase
MIVRNDRGPQKERESCVRAGANVWSAALSQAKKLGIDNWAWRKGQRYGTILCDLEHRTVVDLLADRSTESVAD